MADLITPTPAATELAPRYQAVRAHHRSAGRAPVGRGPDGAVDARREPDEVAPGPHVLVLRDLPARAAASPATGPSTRRTPTSSTPTTRPWAPGTPGPRGGVSRPASPRSRAYRGRVDEAMARLLGPGLEAEVLELVDLGLHHEQQHQELLLMDIKHVLSCNPLQPAYTTVDGRRAAGAARPAAGWPEHGGGLAEIGHGGDGFAFDNELPRHTAHLEPFALADRPVTCGEWLAFIDDGGYARPSCGSPTAGPRRRPRLGGAAVLVRGGRRAWWLFTLGGAAAGRPGRAGLPRELLRGRRLRPLGRSPPAHRGRVGGRAPARPAARPGNFLDPGIAPSPPTESATPTLFGDVWQWTVERLPPVPGLPARAGGGRLSTTASSWSTSTCSAAGAA